MNAFKIISSTFLITVLFISCKNKVENNKITTKNKEKIILKRMGDDVESLELLSSDSIKRIYGFFFSYNLFKEKITIEKVKEILSKDKSYSLFEKEYKSVLAESLIKMCKLSSKGTEFMFVKSKNNIFLESAKISKNNFKLKKDIYIGISKNDFFKKINKNMVAENIIEITDEEQYTIFKFYFKDKILNEIVISNNIEY